MRARDLVYHVACFTCASCGTPLNKGDHFGQRDGLVYCRWETRARITILEMAVSLLSTSLMTRVTETRGASTYDTYYRSFANNDSPRARVKSGFFFFFFFFSSSFRFPQRRDRDRTEREKEREKERGREREREWERERVEIDARSRKGKDVAGSLAACDSIGKRFYRSTGGIKIYIAIFPSIVIFVFKERRVYIEWIQRVTFDSVNVRKGLKRRREFKHETFWTSNTFVNKLSKTIFKSEDSRFRYNFKNNPKLSYISSKRNYTIEPRFNKLDRSSAVFIFGKRRRRPRYFRKK